MADFIQTCNTWASEGKPFLLIVDFELKKPQVILLEDAEREGIRFEIDGIARNKMSSNNSAGQLFFDVFPVEESIYNEAFQFVKKNILHGNSYLLNLTFPTKIKTNLSLEEIFLRSKARYKLYKQDEFVVFSPECFVKIIDGRIYSYPMKGTIDASIPGAEEIILGNEKELWEHNTIVDLIRNDLSQVSKDVCLTKFRYIDRIKTHKGELLQISSEICGQLPENWEYGLGDILAKLLPAGSISGAPKKKTMEIIQKAELDERGYFTGIFGVFDGEGLDSGVMIRYMENSSDGLQFRSGGGITGHSKMESEYKEMLDKVYVPIS